MVTANKPTSHVPILAGRMARPLSIQFSDSVKGGSDTLLSTNTQEIPKYKKEN